MPRKLRLGRLRVAWLALATLAVACTGSTSGTTGDGGADDAAASTESPCARYLACTGEAQPETLAAALAAYGTDGACWTSMSASACEAACRQAIVALHAISPTSPSCALCRSDADCSGATPACDATRGACVACTSAATCPASAPACDTTAGKCVRCVAASDCEAPRPACDKATHTCVECTSGAQCDSGSCLSDHTCCVADSPCGTGVCGTVYDSCGKPRACGGCGAGEYCESTTSSCEPITDTFDCSLNGTSNVCTKYQQYCQDYLNGPGGTTAWCSTMPAACVATPTCACLLAAHEYFAPDTCTEGSGPNGAGVVYVTSRP